MTLTGNATWALANVNPTGATPTASPSQNIETWSQTVLQQSGQWPTDIVFTTGAYNLFLQDPRVQQSVWYLRSGDSDVEFGGGGMTGAINKGRWGGYTLWVYNDWYVDPTSGTEFPMIAGNTVLLTSPALEGVKAFGAILDDDFAYGALAYAPKSWIEPNPGRRHLLMQSAPVVIPSRVNAVLAATVA